ncbi:MAG: MFS transporter [Bradyrhizobiaceae bacterium]|nr:MFS transporter [Bradyrhizobiaceae bacterium]
MEIETRPPRSFKLSYPVLAFLLLAANLRPALTGVGPVLEEIRSNLALSGAAAGLLATLPLLMFGCCSPFARVALVFGLERTLAGCLALTAVGIALRSQGTVAALFGGTVLFAAGIAVANVLMPSLIKRDFPHRIESMTTAYLMVMSLTAATATGIAAPLADHLAGGWRSSLAVWAVLAALTLLYWLPKVRYAEAPAAQKQAEYASKPLWRSALARQITVFMGLQSLIYYVTLAWMPGYLADHGVSRSESGFLLTLSQLVGFAVGFVAPVLLRRGADQRALAVCASLTTAACVLGLAAAPRLAGLWLTVFGASLGITFILAFALIGMRTKDYLQAASLSAMAQATGYLIAATGPFAFGWLHDFTADWTVPMAGLAAVTLVEAAVGLGAGRPGYV